MACRSRSTDFFATELTTVASCAALGLLVLNDHVLKGAGVLPGWITGKLSDLAGLFLAPVLAFALLDGVMRLLGRATPRRLGAIACGVLVALGFTLVKLVPAVNAPVSRWWGPMALDATDLIALPLCGLASWTLLRAPAPRRRPGRVLRLTALVATLLACAATSPAARECHPSWRLLETRSAQIGCGYLDAWVSKSGKEGFGVTVAIRNTTVGATCQVRIVEAFFVDGVYRATAIRLPDVVTLIDIDTDAYVYLPFAFDNQELWRESIQRIDLRSGLLSLRVSAGDSMAQWNIGAKQDIRDRHARYGEDRYGGCRDISLPGSVSPSSTADAGRNDP